MTFSDPRLPKRFWSKVVQTESGCWVWTGARTPAGYGQIQWLCGDGIKRRMAVHRLSYAVANDNIDPNLVIDHLCETKSCVNPDHLDLVTAVENTRRHYERHPVTHCPRGHEYTDGSFYLIRNGTTGYVHRDCKVCRKEYAARYWAKKRAA